MYGEVGDDLIFQPASYPKTIGTEIEIEIEIDYPTSHGFLLSKALTAHYQPPSSA